MAISSETNMNYVTLVENVLNNACKSYDYNGYNITFDKGENLMVNATEMARPFGKTPKDWLRNQSTQDFISTLSAVRQILPTGLVLVQQGGSGEQGTWMHEDVALEFARWLSPAFAIWCNDRIKELMQVGMTATPATLEAMIGNPDLVIGLATQLKQLRTENAEQQKVIEDKTQQLDESKEWFSIKRWAKLHRRNWRSYSWRKLKAVSYELGYEVKKIFDGNYDEVNIYHRHVFEVLYGK